MHRTLATLIGGVVLVTVSWSFIHGFSNGLTPGDVLSLWFAGPFGTVLGLASLGAGGLLLLGDDE